ncbi:MAG TPA: hypothetical protein DEB55_13695 [Microbacterium sp.]|nr:hypothetical protein [Microbacterium sp.]
MASPGIWRTSIEASFHPPCGRRSIRMRVARSASPLVRTMLVISPAWPRNCLPTTSRRCLASRSTPTWLPGACQPDGARGTPCHRAQRSVSATMSASAAEIATAPCRRPPPKSQQPRHQSTRRAARRTRRRGAHDRSARPQPLDRPVRSALRPLFTSRRTPAATFGHVPANLGRCGRGLPLRSRTLHPSPEGGLMVTAVRHLDLEEHLTERDVRILEDLERFRLLTTRQLQRLHFPAAPLGPHVTVSGATRGTTRVLNRLEARGAITRLARRIGGIKHGSAVTIWQLGPAGDRYLRARRGEPRRRRYDEPGLTFVAHTLAVADIAVSLLEQAHAHRFELLELELEPASWRSFNGSGAAVITLKPDLLVVTADASTETHSFIEVDRATEHLPAVLRKCQTYQRHQRTGIEQQARELYPAVVWIVPTIDRAQKIREAIAADRGLEPGMFTIITGEQTLATLAPYGPSSSFTPKGGIT